MNRNQSRALVGMNGNEDGPELNYLIYPPHGVPPFPPEGAGGASGARLTHSPQALKIQGQIPKNDHEKYRIRAIIPVNVLYMSQ